MTDSLTSSTRPRRGIRNAEATRGAIMEVAARRFREDGFDGASVRQIAAEVGVDAALLLRYFGSKEGLFVASLQLEGLLGRALDSDLATLGETMVRHLVSGGDPALRFQIYAALVRASDKAEVHRTLVEAMEATLVGPVAAVLRGRDVDLRARLITAQVGGLLTMLAVIEDRAVLDSHADLLVRYYGAAIQSIADAGGRV